MQPTEAIRQLAGRHSLRLAHSAEALAEADALAAAPGIDDPSLEDLTHLAFVTIDEESSKDLDQALFVGPHANGWEVWYAIADAAWYVRPGTAVHAEALLRGSTYYLPGLVIPMLPRALSEDVVSLNAGVDRRALVFRIVIGPHGEVKEQQIVRARVRSRVKTWYDAVQAWFDGTAPCPGDAEVAASLQRLAEVGAARTELAAQHQVVRFRRTEMSVHIGGDDAGRFIGMEEPRTDVDRWNEQISLLCNTVGARMLRSATDDPDVQAIYRIHDPPTRQALDALERQIDMIAKAHDLDEGRWLWDRARETLDTYLHRLPHAGKGGRVARAIHRQAMVATRSAVFTANPAVHHGVGADVYARFTAPMREVVGVFCHKEMWELLGHAPRNAEADRVLREQVIAESHRARKLQRQLDRDANRLVLDQLLADGGTWRGTVLGMSKGRLYVQLDDPPVDVKVYVRHLEAQHGCELYVPSHRAVLRKRSDNTVVLAVGQAVELTATHRDEETDRWVLRCVRID